jgi:hypothetical protein
MRKSSNPAFPKVSELRHREHRLSQGIVPVVPDSGYHPGSKNSPQIVAKLGARNAAIQSVERQPTKLPEQCGNLIETLTSLTLGS